MSVRAGTDEWPGATLDEVHHASRTTRNLTKDLSTQVLLVEVPGRCMVNRTHHVTMFPLKLPSPAASQEVPSGSDDGRSNDGDSGGFPE